MMKGKERMRGTGSRRKSGRRREQDGERFGTQKGIRVQKIENKEEGIMRKKTERVRKGGEARHCFLKRELLFCFKVTILTGLWPSPWVAKADL